MLTKTNVWKDKRLPPEHARVEATILDFEGAKTSNQSPLRNNIKSMTARDSEDISPGDADRPTDEDCSQNSTQQPSYMDKMISPWRSRSNSPLRSNIKDAMTFVSPSFRISSNVINPLGSPLRSQGSASPLPRKSTEEERAQRHSSLRQTSTFGRTSSFDRTPSYATTASFGSTQDAASKRFSMQRSKFKGGLSRSLSVDRNLGSGQDSPDGEDRSRSGEDGCYGIVAVSSVARFCFACLACRIGERPHDGSYFFFEAP